MVHSVDGYMTNDGFFCETFEEASLHEVERDLIDVLAEGGSKKPHLMLSLIDKHLQEFTAYVQARMVYNKKFGANTEDVRYEDDLDAKTDGRTGNDRQEPRNPHQQQARGAKHLPDLGPGPDVSEEDVATEWPRHGLGVRQRVSRSVRRIPVVAGRSDPEAPEAYGTPWRAAVRGGEMEGDLEEREEE